MTSAITTQAFIVRGHTQNHIKEIIEFVSDLAMHHVGLQWIIFIKRFGHKSPESLANGMLELISSLEHNLGRQAFCGWEMPGDASNPQLDLWLHRREESQQISLLDGLALSLHYFFSGFPRETIQWAKQKSSRQDLVNAVEQWYFNAPTPAQLWMD